MTYQEAIATKTKDAKVVVDFLKSNIFCWFGVFKALISDQGSHFYNKAMFSLFYKYGVVHRVATTYHPQTNGQDEENQENNEKDVGRIGADSLRMLYGAQNCILDSIGDIVFDKAYHLVVEIEHRAYWAVKQCNLAYDQAGKQRKLQLQELNELRLEAYENSRIYKQKVKQFHDQQILRKEFQVGQKLIAGKLCSRRNRLFVITNVFPCGTVELKDANRLQIKLFHEGPALTSGIGPARWHTLSKP
ncbi:hypothetical protein CR513_42197, partial [Mucuna pruriens]